MKKIITIPIIVIIILLSIIVITYENNPISKNQSNVIKPSESITKSNTTGKNYQIGISDGIGVSDKH